VATTTRNRSCWRSLLAATVCAALASCGGGGDDAAPAASLGGSASPPAGASSGGAAATTASTCNLLDFQVGLLTRINQVRASGADCGSDGVFGAAAALVWNDKLTAAADAHSEDMAAKDYFSHTSADGRTLADRIDATGYAWTSVGENIAAGYPTVDSVIDGWIASPGHCANLMNAGFAEVGVACVPGAAGDAYSTYWTMDFGRPR
jgi:uncharacterized protein YkwD